MNAGEVYATVYRVCRAVAARGEPKAVPGHREFALRLPDPTVAEEDEAAVLSSMVSVSPSNDWGLEAFYQCKLETGETLGDFVRREIPNTPQYTDKMEEVAKKYLT